MIMKIEQSGLKYRKFILLLFGVFTLQFSVAQLNVSIDVTSPISCNGVNDGEITVNVTGGTGNYTYRLNSGPWGGSNVFSGLSASVLYRVDVEDDNATPETGFSEITLTEPAELTFTINGPVFCGDNNGVITLTPIGGTGPYIFYLNGINTPHPFTGLAAATYTLGIEDANLCPLAVGTVTSHTLVQDATPPTINTGVAAVIETDYATFNSGVSGTPIVFYGPGAFNFLLTGFSETGNLSFTNYQSAEYSMNITASGASPVAGDIVRVLENNGSGWVLINEYNPAVTGGPRTGAITINSNPALNGSINLRIEVVIVTPGLIYDITAFQIAGILKIDPSTYDSGTPTYIDNVGGSGIATIDYSDNIAWVCTDPGSEELILTREWSATDNCGNFSASTIQTIRVGESPSIGAVTDVTADFCNNTISASMPAGNSDNCGFNPDSISWVLLNGDDLEITNGTGNFPAYLFPYSNTIDTAYTIRWILTDAAGFTDQVDQTVTILKSINIALIPSTSPAHLNVCAGDPASFNIVVSGGTGVYSLPSVSPGAWTQDSGTNADGVYSTSDLGGGVAGDITISVDDNGVCPSGDFVFLNDGTNGYTIHLEVPTNQVGP